MKYNLVFAAILLLSATASAQTALPIKIRVIYDTTDASSSAVAPLLIQKIAAQPKFFTVVKGDERNMSIITDCYRGSDDDPYYSCFYTASEWHGTIDQALLGGAIVVKKSAEDAATALFASIFLDVAERWNSTDRSMLIGELETCLTLAESRCAVPETLVPELKARSISLAEYLRRGGPKP